MKNILTAIAFFFLISSSIPVLGQTDAINDEPMDTVSGRSFGVFGSLGAGLVRNMLSPTVHLSMQYKHKERYSFSAQSTSFFFFSQNADGDFNVYRNTFVGLEFMLNFSPFSKDDPNWNGLGASYLVEARGRQFSEPAGMIYYRRKFQHFSLMPGLMLDDNFEDVWPVITIRL
jgi:hypothetical protein